MASLGSVVNREVAQNFVGKTIAVRSTDLPRLPDGNYYWAQIEGLEAVTTSGTKLGVVDRLFETGANDVMAIKRGKEEILIPYLQDVVRRVDLEKGIIVVDWDAIG